MMGLVFSLIPTIMTQKTKPQLHYSFTSRWCYSLLLVLCFVFFLLTRFQINNPISVEALIVKSSYTDTSLYRTQSALPAAIENQTGLPIDHLLPAFSNLTTLDTKEDTVKVGLYTLFFAAVVYYGYILSPQVHPHMLPSKVHRRPARSHEK